jgi:hypothetical protein
MACQDVFALHHTKEDWQSTAIEILWKTGVSPLAGLT